MNTMRVHETGVETRATLRLNNVFYERDYCRLCDTVC